MPEAGRAAAKTHQGTEQSRLKVGCTLVSRGGMKVGRLTQHERGAVD